MVDDLVVRLIETGRKVSLSKCQSYGIGYALTKWPCIVFVPINRRS